MAPSDIVRGDWVERWLPARFQPYARLARLDRPIGTWLLLFPGLVGDCARIAALRRPGAAGPVRARRGRDAGRRLHSERHRRPPL